MIKIFDAPSINKKEILRYAGGGDTLDLLDDCLKEAEFSYKVYYKILDIKELPFKSESLEKLLENSQKAVVFIATVGFNIDRLILKYTKTMPTRALMFQAIGAERIEALCDDFMKSFENTTARFSVGYGDFDLSEQKKIFEILKSDKPEVYLNKSLLMSPTKSVTAVFGVR